MSSAGGSREKRGCANCRIHSYTARKERLVAYCNIIATHCCMKSLCTNCDVSPTSNALLHCTISHRSIHLPACLVIEGVYTDCCVSRSGCVSEERRRAY